MNTLSGFIILATALAAQLPYLTAAPYPDAISKLLAIAETMTGSKVNFARKADAGLQQIYPKNGLSSTECTQQFLQLNPNLEDLQTYSSYFDMEVDCNGDSSLCTDLTIHLDRVVYHSSVCYDQLRDRSCLVPRSDHAPEQGDSNDATIIVQADIKIPLGTQGGYFETQLTYGGYYSPDKTLAYFALTLPQNMCYG